ncbi:DUF5709 domain-containing protein [Angustibacter speluncae]
MSEISDDVYQPEGDPDQPGESIPDFDNTLDGPDQDDIMDTSYSPPEKPRNSEEGETLEERLAEEEPEVWDRRDPDDDGIGDTSDTDGEVVDDQVGDVRAGRLVAPDEGAHEDAEKDSVATDVGIDGGAASAEEAAVHVVDEDRL